MSIFNFFRKYPHNYIFSRSEGTDIYTKQSDSMFIEILCHVFVCSKCGEEFRSTGKMEEQLQWINRYQIKDCKIKGE